MWSGSRRTNFSVLEESVVQLNEKHRDGLQREERGEDGVGKVSEVLI